ncbi:MAG: NIL domain-containing protein [Akkermansiaceae bacterium]|nr:NIL domain-containing protein [Armatimonadota bacterium]
MRTISELYTFSFSQAMYDTPLITPLAKKFRLEVVIRRAMLSDAGGTMEVRLTGSPEEIGRAIADLSTTGVNVIGPVADTINETNDAEPRPAYIGRGT